MIKSVLQGHKLAGGGGSRNPSRRDSAHYRACSVCNSNETPADRDRRVMGTEIIAREMGNTFYDPHRRFPANPARMQISLGFIIKKQ